MPQAAIPWIMGASMGYSIYSGERNAQQQASAAKKAYAQAQENANKQAYQAEQELNAQNMQSPDSIGANSAALLNSRGGNASTLLSGSRGVNTDDKNAKKRTLLGV